MAKFGSNYLDLCKYGKLLSFQKTWNNVIYSRSRQETGKCIKTVPISISLRDYCSLSLRQ